MGKDIPGRLKVNWDSYWKGIISAPFVESLRRLLIERSLNRLVGSFVISGQPRFCELGAGTGHVSLYLGRKFQADVTLVDNNAKAVELCRRTFSRYPHGYQIIEKDVFDLDMFQRQFDLVISGGLIEHFVGEGRGLILRTHADLVKGNGFILIFVPVRNAWYRLLNEGVLRFFHLLDDIPEVPWSRDELTVNLKMLGFEIMAQTSVISEWGILARRV